MNNISRVGEAGARTTATADGAVGGCETTWNLRLQPVGYPVALESFEMAEIMCDNVTGANLQRPKRVGRVVPWYPAQVLYSQSRYPSLASHVSRAQASGLPGATFDNPLNRNVETAAINLNRSRACGDAPSIAGKSCDEYPLATTFQGLAFGGSRRTFSGCNINAPTNVTGPSGASACMITDSENSAQGAAMAAFYYDYRVLHTDPWVCCTDR
ncbi:NucA/NucB deoxyribonuclease domain-containing protein [Micromonospora zamorensis]|uniref:NucA/NucB deoxyribonuclease domain-containing protein n=1 Tax=Micromonospora zamorensis TaxID=709883 RepID=UPI003D982820